MEQVIEKLYKRDFWVGENLKYVKPHFRLTKAARIANRMARGRQCNLLDVGCGPATLARLLNKNIEYYGIDIAIHDPAPNLLEADFLATPIRFGEKQFDIAVVQGVFEYIGKYQAQKMREIRDVLKKDGRALISYVNFDHVHKHVYFPYSNVQSFDDFRGGLEEVFRVETYFPTSHQWRHREPSRELAKAVQMHVNVNVPFLSRMFAVEYFFICSAGKAGVR